MTQTETLEVGQVVGLHGHTGSYYRVYSISDDHVTLYGGSAGRGGLLRSGFKAAKREDLRAVTDKNQRRRADMIMGLIDIAQASAPKAHTRGRRAQT